MTWAVCFRREDAVAFDATEGIFTFETGLEKINVYKTTLVSLEFPMSQRTIEEKFSQFFYSEGFQTGPIGRGIHMHETVQPLNSSVSIAAQLPLAMQFGETTTVVPGFANVETRTDDFATPAPHGLFVGPNHTCILDEWASLMGEPIQLFLPLNVLGFQVAVRLTCANTTYVSPTEIQVDLDGDTHTDGLNSFIYTPAVRSPEQGAALLQWVMRQFPTANNYDVSFDTTTTRTTVAARGEVQPGTTLQIFSGAPSGLLGWMGFGCNTECAAAGGPDQGVGWLGAAQQTVGGCWPCYRPTLSARADRQTAACRDRGLEYAGMAQLALPAQGFREDFPPALGAGPPITVLRRECDRYQTLACQSDSWVPCGAVRVNPGWYTPVVRPSGVAEPLSGELELRMSPLRFAPPAANQQLSGTTTTIHSFVAETPLGLVIRAPVEMGHYTPHALAETIEINVRAAAVSAGSSWDTFSATFHEDSNQFVLADVSQLPFGLRFEDPFMFDPRRVGFEAKRYFGSFAYAGTPAVMPRRASRGEESRCPAPPVLSTQVDALLTMVDGTGLTGADNGVHATALTGGSGFGAVAEVWVVSNVVGAITLTGPGTGYVVGDVLTIPANRLNFSPNVGSTAVAITLEYQAFVYRPEPCCPPTAPTVSTNQNSLLTSVTSTFAVGTAGTYTNVNLTGGSGQNLQATFVVAAGPVIEEITVTNPGSGYAVGDVLTVATNALPPASSQIDIRLSAHDFNRPQSSQSCFGWPINWYSVNEGGATRRFHFIGTPPRTVYVQCIGCPAPGTCATDVPPFPTSHAMNLQTSLALPNNTPGITYVPFALPYQKHDIVVLSNLATSRSYYAVVLEDAGRPAVDSLGDPIKRLSLFAPGIQQSDIGCGWTWTVQAAPSYSPFSMVIPDAEQTCTDLRPIPNRILGLPRGASLWKLDTDNTIVAPNLMDLEHVDYILMDLGWDCLRKQDTFQVSRGQRGNSVGFAKLVLYPSYQVHGLLPRDLITTSMDSPVRFQVRFQNPDLSNYELNGRTFSFSLQFICPSGVM
jgi:hypothetical protein